MGAKGRRARWVLCSAAALVGALGGAGQGRAADPESSVVVSILTPEPGQVCVRSSLAIEVQIGYALLVETDGVLAPVITPTPVRIGLDATASRGTVTPASQMVGPFTAYGQRRQVVLRYRATAPGHEDLAVTGTLAGGGTWKATLSFEVVRCKLVVVGTADMSPATGAANEAAAGMWTIGASLDLDGEVALDESGASGTGAVAFSVTGEFDSDVGVLACSLDPQWSGSGTVGIQVDGAQLDDDGSLVVDLDIGDIPVNATTVSCEGVGGIAVSMNVPPWVVPAATLDLDPVAGPGGTATEEFPYDKYQLPMTITLVERPA